MSKLDPSQIHQVLKETKAPLSTHSNSKRDEPNAFKNLLETSGLGEEEVLQSIGSVMRGGETDQVRLRAAELGAKLHGFMQNDAISIPSVTIVIKDAQVGSINSILLPR